MTYDEELGEFVCQQGKRLSFQREKVRKTRTGYESVKPDKIFTNFFWFHLEGES
jgi:hypothetical protein